MVKKVLRSAEKFSEPFPLSPLPLYLSPIYKQYSARSLKKQLFLTRFDSVLAFSEPLGRKAPELTLRLFFFDFGREGPNNPCRRPKFSQGSF